MQNKPLNNFFSYLCVRLMCNNTETIAQFLKCFVSAMVEQWKNRTFYYDNNDYF